MPALSDDERREAGEADVQRPEWPEGHREDPPQLPNLELACEYLDMISVFSWFFTLPVLCQLAFESPDVTMHLASLPYHQSFC
jgi:hypothetical protein